MKRLLANYAWDAIAMAGAAAIAAGLWWIYPPAALLALGAGLVFLGVWGASLLARERARRRNDDRHA